MKEVKFRSILGALLLTLGLSFSALAEEMATSSEAAASDVESQEKISDYVGYKKGFYIQSPDQKFKLKVGGYIQGLFLGEILEGTGDTDTFRMRRARLKFSGHMFTKNVKYALEYDFARKKMLTSVIQLVFVTPIWS